MARKKTIGILSAIVTADAAQLRNEFKSVDNTIRRHTTGWQKQLKGGLKLGAGIMGAQAGIGALVREIQHVIANVERIPGINPEAVATIVEARTEFAHFRNTIDGGIAKMLAFGASIGKAVGAGAAMLAGASGDDVVKGLGRQETPDEIAETKDDEYWNKVRAARERLVETNKKAAQASMTDAKQIGFLREEAERYDRFAQSSSITTLQRLNAETEAAERTASANQKLAAMKKELKDAEEKLAASSFGAARAKMTDAESMEFLEAKAMRLQTELSSVYNLLKDSPDNPDYLQLQIDKTKELTETNKQLEKAADRVARKFEAVGLDMAQSLESAAFSGGSLREMLQGIYQDLLRIAFRSAITEPLGKLLGGGLKSFFGGFFAEGGRPPAGKVSVVGEEGPELFVPDGAGTIVPNHALRSSGGGGGTFYIDARGADQSGLARLEAMIRALHGSVEHRALAAVGDFRRRGASAAA
jgi:hypothetical protein